MNFRLLLFLLFCSNLVFSQRTIPNPIILVHGWTGSYETWDKFTEELRLKAFLTIETNWLNYNLNCDNNLSTSNLFNDVCDNTGSLGNKDVYVVNFKSDNNTMSNQSAVVKQGYALKLAISRVLNATRADNVVLLGHSMGGLAIREYLQNSSNWQPDGRHHVAKLATIGTPHRGSDTSGGILTNAFSSKDENSESVRDLRESYFYSNCTRGGQLIKCPGVYLWGGQETRSWMKTNVLGGSSFYNIDVNCNGNTGDNITGLNQKSISNNLDFACVIGGPNFNDGIVSVESQNLNTIYPNLAELFYWDCNKSTGLICHTQEPKQAFTEMLQALDEPKRYLIDVNFGVSNKGFFTSQPNGSSFDRDDYTFYAPQRGVLTFSAGSVPASNASVVISDSFGNTIVNQLIGNGITNTIQITAPGSYRMAFQGSSLGTWVTYNFSLNFCSMPNLPIIMATSATTFCDGQSTNLFTVGGYDSYRWFRNGSQISINANQISVSQAGTYAVEASKCGVASNSTNSITTTVKPTPPKPEISKEDQPDQFLLTSNSTENNQWLLNGNQVNGATAQKHTPQELGLYTVRVSKDGCSSTSEGSVVRMEKPTITLVGGNPLCDGDSSKLVAPSGFGVYIFSDGTREITNNKSELIVKKSGRYSVVTKRGKFVSVASDPINFRVNPIPAKPLLTLESIGLKSSSPVNNQWFLNGIAIKDSTGQFLRGFGSGVYSVRVIENGCFSESNVLVITSTEPNQSAFPIKLYPNPNEGMFWVELPQTYTKWQVNIYDMQGKQVMSKVHSDSAYNKEKIDMKSFKGSYILRVTTEKATQSVKFIIE